MAAGMCQVLFPEGRQERQWDWCWEGDKSYLDDGFHPSALARGELRRGEGALQAGLGGVGTSHDLGGQAVSSAHAKSTWRE